jgi:hypothetical protein
MNMKTMAALGAAVTLMTAGAAAAQTTEETTTTTTTPVEREDEGFDDWGLLGVLGLLGLAGLRKKDEPVRHDTTHGTSTINRA